MKILCLALLLLPGCANHLKDGVVVDKYYTPLREYLMLIPIIIPIDQRTSTTILIPYFIHEGEHYVVRLMGDYKNKKYTETFYVTPKRYSCASIGNYFVVDDSCFTEPYNDWKEKRENQK